MGKHKIKHLSMLSIKSNIYHAICSKLTKEGWNVYAIKKWLWNISQLPCRDITLSTSIL